VFVAAAALEAHCLALALYWAPFFTAAVGILSVDCPELLGFRRRDRRIMFCFRRIPYSISYKASPQGGRDKPEARCQCFEHASTMCIYVVHEYNMSASGHIII
jgi:hypothetical protein